MTKWVSLIAGLMLVTVNTSLLAAGPKLGYVDAVKLVEQAPQGQKALKRLEEEFGSREQQLRVLRDKALALEQDLQKNGLVLSDSDRDAKTKELREMERELQRSQRELREDYNLRRNEELGKLQKVVTKAVIEIAKEEKYDLIVQQAVYFSPETDMTQKVLERLQKGQK